jgi:hypothetical protein
MEFVVIDKMDLAFVLERKTSSDWSQGLRMKISHSGLDPESTNTIELSHDGNHRSYCARKESKKLEATMENRINRKI